MPDHYLKYILITAFLILSTLLGACTSADQSLTLPYPSHESVWINEGALQIITLPEPTLDGEMSLEKAILNRRSVRNFKETSLTIAQIGQLLWAAQGITHPSGLRSAPSAGARYPLELYAATAEGLFHYQPHTHSLRPLTEKDLRPNLHQAALQQSSVLEAPLVIIITGVMERTAQRYGDDRTPQYVYLEAGHAAQNILLQVVALDLGAVPIGAFYEDQIIETLALPDGEVPLYLIPIGHPQQMNQDYVNGEA